MTLTPRVDIVDLNRMDYSFWNNLWETNDIKFHKIDIHPLLHQFSHLLTPGKTIVPLCGKTLDMMYLWKEHHHIVGIELSTIPCEAFFRENHLRYKIRTVGDFTVYQGDKIEIWCGDIFNAPEEFWKGMTGIYDRASLVAFPKDMQKNFVTLLKDQIKKNSKTFQSMLLITVEFEEKNNESPPFSVSEKDVKKLFSKFLKIKKVSSRLDPSLSGRAPRFLKLNVQEKAYILK